MKFHIIMERTVFKGIAANRGAAYGKVIVKASPTKKHYGTGTCISGSMIRKERSRYFRAVEEANKTLDTLLLRADKEGKTIIEAEKFLLNDAAPNKRIVGLIKDEKIVAEEAVRRAAAYFINLFNASEEESIRARSEAIAVIEEMVLDNLDDSRNEFTVPNEPVIIVGENLTAADMIALNRTSVKGIALTMGSRLSHAAIIAKSYNIPMLTGCKIENVYSLEGMPAILDSRVDSLIVNPDENDIENLRAYKKENHSALELVKHFLSPDSSVKIYANVGSIEDIERTISFDIEGVGLFRSEFLYLAKDVPPTEEEQFLIYKEALLKNQGKLVTIRTADFGEDKTPKYLNIKDKERGMEFSLRENTMLETQLRAILRASHFGKLSVMFPMVRTEEEFKAAKSLINRLKTNLNENHIPYDRNILIGVMIETKEAVSILDRLAKMADFFSIGTNDLIKYTLNISREAFFEADLKDSCKDVIKDSVTKIVKAAKDNNIAVGVCGELASSPEWIPFLEKAGVDILSIGI